MKQKTVSLMSYSVARINNTIPIAGSSKVGNHADMFQYFSTTLYVYFRILGKSISGVGNPMYVSAFAWLNK